MKNQYKYCMVYICRREREDEKSNGNCSSNTAEEKRSGNESIRNLGSYVMTWLLSKKVTCILGTYAAKIRY